MALTKAIEVTGGDMTAALQAFLRTILSQDDVAAVLAPQHLPMKSMVMPALITDPEKLAGVDPLSPAFPMNTAKVAARLTRKPAGGRVVAVMRPCEIRAFIELVKLHQARTEEVILIGTDCLGAFANTAFFEYAAARNGDGTAQFCKEVLSHPDADPDKLPLASACRVCEHPLPESADIAIHLFGGAPEKRLIAQSQSAGGEALLNNLGLTDAIADAGREAATAALVARRTARRDAAFAETHSATESMEKLTTYLAGCVNCYNCRVACPVCYCKECVFVTDVFNHDPAQYLRWAERKGAIKMPTDTVFYHLTRLTHMSTACVGCGQCSNACPNDIPVMELFRMVAHQTQQAFAYEPGRSVEDAPPLSEFREDEFQDVVGIH